MPECDGYETREGWVDGHVIVMPGERGAQGSFVPWEWTVEFGLRKYAVGYDPIGRWVAYADPSAVRPESIRLPEATVGPPSFPASAWALSATVELLAKWIEWRLSRSWMTAELAVHQNRSGEGFYLIREEGRSFWLIIRARVFRSMRMAELTECLDKMNWLDRLQADRSVAVELTGIRPTMSRVSSLVV
jgi:hypothetical protein